MLTIEEAMPKEIVDKLELMGHKIDRIGTGGVTQAVEIADDGELIGVHDPRVPGKAAGGKRRSEVAEPVGAN